MIKNYESIFNDKWYYQTGLCLVCRKPLSMGTPQLAHIICKSKANIKRYGIDIIDHHLNLALVCSLECNSSVLINKEEREKRHIEKIISDKDSGII